MKDAALRTLRDVAGTTAAGSELVFQFVKPPTTLANDEAALVAGQADRYEVEDIAQLF